MGGPGGGRGKGWAEWGPWPWASWTGGEHWGWAPWGWAGDWEGWQWQEAAGKGGGGGKGAEGKGAGAAKGKGAGAARRGEGHGATQQADPSTRDPQGVVATEGVGIGAAREVEHREAGHKMVTMDVKVSYGALTTRYPALFAALARKWEYAITITGRSRNTGGSAESGQRRERTRQVGECRVTIRSIEACTAELFEDACEDVRATMQDIMDGVPEGGGLAPDDADDV
ncbi:MAG: hypothetical protein GY772_29765, partial [bacterium]|nr:hypothetical protein [bacterium]